MFVNTKKTFHHINNLFIQKIKIHTIQKQLTDITTWKSTTCYETYYKCLT